MLGGSSGNGGDAYKLTESRTQILGDRLCEIAKKVDGTLMITPSRRTGDANCEILANRVKKQHNIIFEYGTGRNPYLAMLAFADTLIITNDSVSMVSEAYFTGKPVYVLNLPEYKAEKKRNYQFIRSAINKGMVRPFNGKLEQWNYPKFDEITRIAPLIKEQLTS